MRIHPFTAVDRCAVCFATSATWYLHTSQLDKALEQCNYVIDRILPVYDKKKFNGQVDKARETYNKFLPEGVDNHFAVGRIHKSMTLLLRICEGSSDHYL